MPEMRLPVLPRRGLSWECAGLKGGGRPSEEKVGEVPQVLTGISSRPARCRDSPGKEGGSRIRENPILEDSFTRASIRPTPRISPVSPTSPQTTVFG